MGTVFSVAYGDLLEPSQVLAGGLSADASASPGPLPSWGRFFLPVSVTGCQPTSPTGVFTPLYLEASPGGVSSPVIITAPNRPAPPWDSRAENVQGCHSLGPAKSPLCPAVSRGTPRPTPYFPERAAYPWPPCGRGSQGMLRGSGSPLDFRARLRVG